MTIITMPISRLAIANSVGYSIRRLLELEGTIRMYSIWRIRKPVDFLVEEVWIKER